MAKHLLKNISPIYDNVDQSSIRQRMMEFLMESGCVVEQESKYEVIFQLGESATPDKIKSEIKMSAEISPIAKYFSMGFTPSNKLYMRIKRI